MPANRVFISCVSDEFEKAGSPFAGLRTDLHRYISRAKVDVRVQEYFAQSPDDTVKKLADEVKDSAAVVHLVGEKVGAIAHAKAVADFLAATPDFLAKHPDLRKDLGDCSGLSYTQWEAFLALHFGIPLFVYATDAGANAQDTHLTRLKDWRRYAAAFNDHADLFGQLIGDLHDILPAVPKFVPKFSPSRLARHAAKQFFGRDSELALLDRAWADPGTHVLSIVAWGGVGKTSLVSHWLATRMIAKNWPGVERYYDWSFYSQGTGDSRQTSSDLFINDALTFFGDPDPVKGSPWERGVRLAGLVRQHRTLLVLDGVEPLQYPPTDRSGQAGRLKDQALEALLQSLVQDNNGLCVVTTREHLANIDSYPTQTEHKLDKLMLDAAKSLLRHIGLVGTEAEMEKAWKEVGGHALTLLLLGRFIFDAYPDDPHISRISEVSFEEADLERQGRSAFRVMTAYEKWLKSAGEEQQRELAILRLMGLFDRPMRRDCFAALRAEPVIAGLTEALVKVKDQQVNIAVKRLREVELISESPDALDAHPLIREYFALQLQRDKPEAFKEAHSRLFDFLCKNTPHRPDTLDGLGPLYEAVTHGCLAGRHQEACRKVYVDRILRGTGYDGFYSTKKLGAIGADLAAVAAFFDEPWSKVSPNLTDGDQAWLLNAASHRLRGLGRLTEALQPMRVAMGMTVQQKTWKFAAVGAGNLSEFEVTLGRLMDAVNDGRDSITHADQSGDAGQRMSKRCTAADALHQSGARAEAGTLFADAERMQKEDQPQYELLYSLRGFRYCDWLLAPAEHAAWQVLLRGTGVPSVVESQATICDEVELRATTTLRWVIPQNWLLDIALDHLTLARVGLIRAILTPPLPQPTLDLPHILAAVNHFRKSGDQAELPLGLLTAALYHFVRGEHDIAREYLTETQQIAERGPMPLFLADVHLHRARMFRDKAELAKAAKLIRDLGYGRRYDELADAEEAAKGWPG